MKAIRPAHFFTPVLIGMLVLSGMRCSSQTAWFIDGYHGGIYGHLPAWQTSFMVEKLAQFPDWKINLELEPESWDTIALHDPVSYEAFRKLFADQSAAGRIEYINPAYGQSYMYNISGESIIRQLDYGMKKLRQHFPGAVFSTYSSEEPCFTSALPQILRSFGFRYASLKNPNTCWGGYSSAFGRELVNWIGPDGTSLVTVPRYEIEALKPHSIWETIATSNSPEYVRLALDDRIRHPVGMCLQDAGWAYGPWLRGRNQADQSGANGGSSPGAGKQADPARKVYVPTVYQTWRGYFENVVTQAPDRDWKFSQEDVLVSLMWGSQVLQRIAQQVRVSENKIIMAEKLAAIAGVMRGSSWPGASLDEAWRTLLLSQHHDCWIVPYNGKQGDTWADKVVRWTGNTNVRSEAVTEASMKELSGSVGKLTALTDSLAVDGGSGRSGGSQAGVGAGIRSANTPGKAHKDERYIRVFNTLAAPRNEYVRVAIPAEWLGARIVDSGGHAIGSQVVSGRDTAGIIVFRAQVPSMGYSTYRLRKVGFAASSPREAAKGAAGNVGSVAHATQLKNGLFRIETDLYEILLDPAKGGTIKSWIAKRFGNKEFVQTGEAIAASRAAATSTASQASNAGPGGSKYFNELRGNFYNAGGFRSSAESPAAIRILENGPEEVQLEIKASIAGEPFTQIITVRQGQPRVDVHLVIDWKDNPAIGEYDDLPKDDQTRKAYYDDRYKLLALFPLRLASQKLYKNAPFDVTESRLANTFFNSWDSIKNNVLLNWVDVEDGEGRYGMALLSDHTTSYSHGENFPLGLTLQYSGNGIFYRNYGIDGPSELNYAWIPHAGKWDQAGIWTEGTKWNEPLRTQFTDEGDPAGASRSLLRIIHSPLAAQSPAVRANPRADRPGVDAGLAQSGLEVSSMTVRGEDLLVRLFNAEGYSSSFRLYPGFAADAVQVIALDGSLLRELPVRREESGQWFVELSMPRFGIRTIKFIHAKLK